MLQLLNFDLLNQRESWIQEDLEKKHCDMLLKDYLAQDNYIHDHLPIQFHFALSSFVASFSVS